MIHQYMKQICAVYYSVSANLWRDKKNVN